MTAHQWPAPRTLFSRRRVLHQARFAQEESAQGLRFDFKHLCTKCRRVNSCHQPLSLVTQCANPAMVNSRASRCSTTDCDKSVGAWHTMCKRHSRDQTLNNENEAHESDDDDDAQSKCGNAGCEQIADEHLLFCTVCLAAAIYLVVWYDRREQSMKDVGSADCRTAKTI